MTRSSRRADPLDVWEAILHEVALARAESGRMSKRERRIARQVKARIDALIASTSTKTEPID